MAEIKRFKDFVRADQLLKTSLIVGGLHLEDIPREVEEVILFFEDAIEEIKVRREPDGYHWSMEVVYDESILRDVLLVRELRKKYI